MMNAAPYYLKPFFLLIMLPVIFLFFIQRCVPLSQQNQGAGNKKTYYTKKRFRTKDYIYEDSIRTVQIYRETGDVKETLNPPVLSVHQSGQLAMEFDELGDRVYNYYFKIIHCNADWEKSALKGLDYVEDYNEFLINEYQLSMSTRVPYVHYYLNIPEVKTSGNYIVMVYRGGNPDDIVITRRFVAYETKIDIQAQIDRSSGVKERFSNHQVNFKIFYENYDNPMPNPAKNLQVTLRQNFRWDNAIYNLKPLYIDDDRKILDYTHFDLKNNFPALNEFRVFDLRRIRSNARNIQHVEIKENRVHAWVMKDKPRDNRPYTQYVDLNGRYIIGNTEMGVAATDADYADVTFTLETNERPGSNIYVFGALSDWKLDNQFMMRYDHEKKAYTTTASLKQGFYNYYYVTAPGGEDEKPSAAPLEGSFFNTENQYDIIVYHRPIGARADKVIGYTSLSFPTAN